MLLSSGMILENALLSLLISCLFESSSGFSLFMVKMALLLLDSILYSMSNSSFVNSEKSEIKIVEIKFSNVVFPVPFWPRMMLNPSWKVSVVGSRFLYL